MRGCSRQGERECQGNTFTIAANNWHSFQNPFGSHIPLLSTVDLHSHFVTNLHYTHRNSTFQQTLHDFLTTDCANITPSHDTSCSIFLPRKLVRCHQRSNTARPSPWFLTSVPLKSGERTFGPYALTLQTSLLYKQYIKDANPIRAGL